MLPRVAPLNNAFAAVSILGIMISVFYISSFSSTWGFTFSLFFILMFIASMISMTYSPVLPEMSKKR